MRPAEPSRCGRCGAALPAQAAFCPSCGQSTGPVSVSPAPEAERILFKETAIAYKGWFDRVRMSTPFAGTPGYLALTSQRLVFVKGAVRGRFGDLPEMNAALARRGGFSFPLRDISEAVTDSQVGVAIGGGEARLGVKLRAASGEEAHTFVVPTLAATYLGMDAWVILIQEAKKSGGVLPP